MIEYKIFAKALERAKHSGVEIAELCNVVVFLEKEIDRYREKITTLENHIDTQNAIIAEPKRRCESEPTTLEAVQENTSGEIIKALADNGYNTIVINCYKNIESEG